MDNTIKRILERAAAESEYVKRGDFAITPSRAGIPLLTQVLELLVLPKLPQPKGAGEMSFNNKMSIAQGFLYESALYEEFIKEYGEDNVWYQEPISYGVFKGTADFLIKTEDEIIVIDAKAVNVGTKRELMDRKIGDDRWGYRTQLAIYALAVADTVNSNAPVKAMWYCWSPGVKKQWKVKMDAFEIIELANRAVTRAKNFELIKQELDGELGDVIDFEQAAEMATSNPLELIRPKDFFYGRPAPSAGFHFNPYSHLFFYDISAEDDEEEDGYPIERELIKKVTLRLMMDAHKGIDVPYEEYVKELNEEFS